MHYLPALTGVHKKMFSALCRRYMLDAAKQLSEAIRCKRAADFYLRRFVRGQGQGSDANRLTERNRNPSL